MSPPVKIAIDSRATWHTVKGGRTSCSSSSRPLVEKVKEKLLACTCSLPLPPLVVLPRLARFKVGNQTLVSGSPTAMNVQKQVGWGPLLAPDWHLQSNLINLHQRIPRMLAIALSLLSLIALKEQLSPTDHLFRNVRSHFVLVTVITKLWTSQVPQLFYQIRGWGPGSPALLPK